MLPPMQSAEAQNSVLLSSDEQSRAAQYRTPQARHQFVITRKRLRVLLGAYLQTPPKELQFTYSVRGKPALVVPESGKCLGFNVSHSHERILYAVGRESSLGVDLEWLDPSIQTTKLARRICTPSEWEVFAQRSALEQPHSFFKLWTRKEAIIKLLGDRLFARLSTLTVPLDPLPMGAWVWVDHHRLWLQDLALGGGFVGAIAASDPIQTLTYREWDDLGH